MPARCMPARRTTAARARAQAYPQQQRRKGEVVQPAGVHHKSQDPKPGQHRLAAGSEALGAAAAAGELRAGAGQGCAGGGRERGRVAGCRLQRLERAEEEAEEQVGGAQQRLAQALIPAGVQQGGSGRKGRSRGRAAGRVGRCIAGMRAQWHGGNRDCFRAGHGPSDTTQRPSSSCSEACMEASVCTTPTNPDTTPHRRASKK